MYGVIDVAWNGSIFNNTPYDTRLYIQILFNPTLPRTHKDHWINFNSNLINLSSPQLKAFSMHVPLTWNKLPSILHSISSTSLFKTKLNHNIPIFSSRLIIFHSTLETTSHIVDIVHKPLCYWLQVTYLTYNPIDLIYQPAHMCPV